MSCVVSMTVVPAAAAVGAAAPAKRTAAVTVPARQAVHSASAPARRSLGLVSVNKNMAEPPLHPVARMAQRYAHRRGFMPVLPPGGARACFFKKLSQISHLCGVLWYHRIEAAGAAAPRRLCKELG